MTADPRRTCVGCRRRGPVSELVRIAREPGGRLVVDRAASGRGAWLCKGCENGLPAIGCLEQAIRRRAFSRAFRVAVSATAEAVLHEMVTERARMNMSGEAQPASRRRD